MRNVTRFRNLLKRFIKEVRAGQVKSENDSDLLSILINSDLYRDDEDLVVDEIVTFFGAGMRTIQISTTNTLCYLLQNENLMKKVCDETFPVLEQVKANIIEDLDYDKVMEFNELTKIYSESLRIQPPVAISGF